MSDLTDGQVADALTLLGNYRVLRAQKRAQDGAPDGISGALLLALGLRETGLRNIQGGAKQVNGHWVPQDDPKLMDVGVFQISRRYHADALAHMPAVTAGTWGPVVAGVTANTAGFCPQYERSLDFVLQEMHESIAFAIDHLKAYSDEILTELAVAAHNAGAAGALQGYEDGDVDKYTAGGDYSAWVLRHRTKVNAWLAHHPNWRPA